MSEEIVPVIERPARFASIMEEVDYETTLERVAAAAARGWAIRYYLGTRGFRFIGRNASGGRLAGLPSWNKQSALKLLLNGIEDEHLLTP